MPSLVTFGETSLRLTPRDGERFEAATDLRVRVSGTESDAAVAASRLGADALWVSKLPDTPLGRRVERALRERGVETEIGWADDGRQGLRFVERGAPPRTDRRLADRIAAAAATVEPSDLRMDRIQRAEVALVAGGTLALSERAAETAGAVARAAGSGTVAVDVDYRPEQWSGAVGERLDPLLDSADVLFLDESSAGAVFDRTGDPREAAHAIAAERGLDLVVVRQGERGAVAVRDGVVHEQDGIEVEAVDPAGRRAAFTGAFLARLIDGADADAALRTGVAAGALVQTTPGSTAEFTAGEVERTADGL